MEEAMAKKSVLNSQKMDTAKADPQKSIIPKHHYAGLPKGFSFANHNHGRVNNHSIGFNHEPGTM